MFVASKPLLQVVGEDEFIVTQIQSAIGDDRIRPHLYHSARRACLGQGGPLRDGEAADQVECTGILVQNERTCMLDFELTDEHRALKLRAMFQ